MDLNILCFEKSKRSVNKSGLGFRRRLKNAIPRDASVASNGLTYQSWDGCHEGLMPPLGANRCLTSQVPTARNDFFVL